MSNERDELIYVIIAANGEQDEELADAILAAGYRKPRTITAVEELDALGLRSTIIDADGEVWVNDGDSLDQWGSVTHPESYGGPKWIGPADVALPATVLYEPQP
jgi:hypothetical protein